MECTYYSANESKTDSVSNANFWLHSHDDYEIYLFIDGDSKYIVEENTYSLNQGDVIIIRKHEMHRIYHNSNGKYHRFVITVSPEFFRQKNCLQYETAFLENSKKIGNKINAEIVHSSGLYDAIMRLKKYSNNFTSIDTPITDSAMTEILYILNIISSFSFPDESSGTIKDIIAYINNNFTEEITLDTLVDKFFISKYYLCRAFKKATGLTIQNYIKQKRLTHVHELCSSGITISQAATLSGFNDYSSFYRTYVKQYNITPKSHFKHSVDYK